MNNSSEEALREKAFELEQPIPRAILPSQGYGRRRVALLLIGAVGASIFYWVTVAVLSGSSVGIDETILRYLHRYEDHRLYSFANAMSTLVTTISVLILSYLLYRRFWRMALFWFCSAAGAALLCGIAKKLMQRHRPDLWDVPFPHSTFGFPSGHATQSAAIVFALLLVGLPPKWRRTLLLIGGGFTALVGLCRVYLGLHYPTDVAAGWALALAWVSATACCFNISRYCPVIPDPCPSDPSS